MTDKVAVMVEGQLIRDIVSYSVENDMLSPADGFQLSVAPLTRKLYELCKPDASVQIYINGTVVLSGFIDDRTRRGSRDAGNVLSVSGRDRGGRLVDESMALTTFRGLSLRALAEKISWPWFSKVSFSNAENRRRVRGKRAALAPVANEPVIKLFNERTKTRRKVEPGEKRWDVLSYFLEPAQLLAWSNASGDTLIVGQPNYRQGTQYHFRALLPSTTSVFPANVEHWEVIDSSAERYTTITAMGAARGDGPTYSPSMLRNQATAKSKNLRRTKHLIVADDDIKNPQDAEDRAKREMRLRDAKGHVIKLTVSGHSHELGKKRTLYAFDTMCQFVDELIGLSARYLIVSAEFTGARTAQNTSLTLVPEGAELSL